jgi:hypothetical protein
MLKTSRARGHTNAYFAHAPSSRVRKHVVDAHSGKKHGKSRESGWQQPIEAPLRKRIRDEVIHAGDMVTGVCGSISCMSASAIEV